MASSGQGVGSLDRVRAIFEAPIIYALGDQVHEPSPELGGRPRLFPNYMPFGWLALMVVFKSSRQVEAEPDDPQMWRLIRQTVRATFPDEPERWMWGPPMRRHHFQYAREAILQDQSLIARIFEEYEKQAVELAKRVGLCELFGGSYTHPDLDRLLYADGKVITPLYKAKRGSMVIDKRSGKMRLLKADPDAQPHVTGGGTPAYGNKFVLTAVRSSDVHGRVVLGMAHAPEKGGEASVAVDLIGRLASKLPGAQAVVYDGAFRGVHLQKLMHDHGILPIVPVPAASGGKRVNKPRTERRHRVGAGTIKRPDGVEEACQLWVEAGALCLAEVDEGGEITLVRLRRRQTKRRPMIGSWAWYNVYDVPDDCGGGTVWQRLDTTDEDRARDFNRTEHLRPIPPDDPDFRRVYPRRSDAESINRGLDDSHYLRRGRSVGAQRQLLDVLGYGIAVNALTEKRHRQRLRDAA